MSCLTCIYSTLRSHLILLIPFQIFVCISQTDGQHCEDPTKDEGLSTYAMHL